MPLYSRNPEDSVSGAFQDFSKQFFGNRYYLPVGNWILFGPETDKPFWQKQISDETLIDLPVVHQVVKKFLKQEMIVILPSHEADRRVLYRTVEHPGWDDVRMAAESFVMRTVADFGVH